MEPNVGIIKAKLQTQGNIIRGQIGVGNRGGGGVTDYRELTHKPFINGVELVDNISGDQLGLAAKSNTYTKVEVDEIIASISQGTIEIVAELPIVGQPNIIYLVPAQPAYQDNAYLEYVYLTNQSRWELIGTTYIDLSNYVTKTELVATLTIYVTNQQLNQAFLGYYNKTDINLLLNGKANVGDIPTNLSDLSEDATHRVVTDTEKITWNNKSDFSGSYNDLKDKPKIPDPQIQSDWNQNDNTKVDFIKNKPNIPAAQIQSDWNQSDNSKADFIKNKPNIPNAQIQSDWNQSDDQQVDFIKNKPTIPAEQVNSDWNASSGKAKILNKPTIPEIVANPVNTTAELTSIGINGTNYSIPGGGSGGAVDSVNGKTGDVILDASDVGALPDDTPLFSGDYNDLENKPNIPNELSDLQDDANHRVVTDTEKTTWNNKSSFSGSYNDLTDKPALGSAASKDVAASGNAGSNQVVLGNDSRLSNARTPVAHDHMKSDIIDFPTLGTAAEKDSTALLSDGSTDLIEAGAVKQYVDSAVSSAYKHAGTKTCVELTSSLLIAANVGNEYNITDSGTTTADFIEGQGHPIREGANVGIAEVSEGVYKFDLLSGFIDTSNFVEKSSTTGLIKNDGTIDSTQYVPTSAVGTAAAKNVPVSGDAASGEVVLGSDTRLSNARPASDVYDWAKASTKPSYTKSEVGLGNVDNTSDTTKKANFTGSIASENTGFVTGGAVYAALGDKVDKVEGKGLSTNDYDNTAKGIVDGVTNALAGKADKVSSATSGNLAGLDANGNLTDSGVAKTDIDDMQDELSTDSATATGNPINFSTKSAQNAESTIIDLEPIQDLHGYDKPWVGGAGKNILPMTVDGIKSANTGGIWSGNSYTSNSGVVFSIITDSDNNVIGIKVVSNSAPSNSVYFYFDTCFLDAGSYKLASNRSTASNSVELNGVSGASSFADPITFTVNESVSTNGRIKIASGYIGTQYFYPVLCLTTEADATFTPYTNICSISGRSEIGILGTNGKESTDPDYEVSNDFTISLGQTVYGGTLDVENGVLRATYKKIALTSSSQLTGFSTSSQYGAYARIQNTNDCLSTDASKVYGYCSMCEYVSYDNRLITANQNRLWSDSYVYIRASVQSNVSTVEELFAIFEDAEICYELATTITINLTPHQISILEGVNNISTTGDKITLTYRDGKVATLGDLKEAIDNLPTGGDYHEYSTEEKVVGKWIDGKTLYEKTYSETVAGGGSVELEDNIDYAQMITASYYTSVGSSVVSPQYISNSAFINCLLSVDPTTHKMILLNMHSAQLIWIVTIQYTKSTDPTPN